MKGILLTLFILIGTAWACPEKTQSKTPLECNTNYSRSLLEDQLIELLNLEYFEELNEVNIAIKELNSDAYYLATGIKSLLRKPKNRKYFIKVNPKLYDCAPTDRAMKSILAHELVHIKDYLNGGRMNMLGFGLKYVLMGAKVERGTDLRVIKDLGLGEGLIEYREWIYQLLTPKDLKKKKKRYYTPIEIRDLLND